jgi:UDP-3-O-[3-hydroxymyristoyl] glucosamine N-acyltransferase
VGVAGHLTIGDRARVAAQSGVTHDLPPDQEYLGSPARRIAEARRIEAVIGRLPEMRRQARDLARRVEDLAQQVEGRRCSAGRRTRRS